MCLFSSQNSDGEWGGWCPSAPPGCYLPSFAGADAPPAPGEGCRQVCHINLQVLQSRDKCANVTSRRRLPVALACGIYPSGTVSPHAHTQCWGRGRSCPLSPQCQSFGALPASPPVGRKSHSARCPRRSGNGAEVSNSKGFCYGNAEPCPLGWDGGSQHLPGPRQAAGLNLCSPWRLLGGCRRLKPEP